MSCVIDTNADLFPKVCNYFIQPQYFPLKSENIDMKYIDFKK